MEVGGRERLYTYRYTVTTVTPALRWAAMRAILRDKVTRRGKGDDDCFYIVLFSALEQTLRSHVILHE